jgi:hypothetical protein
MNKFLLGIFVALVGAFLLSCLGAPPGIIEGEGFRMVRNGQTLWELMPDEKGGIKISFSPGGKQVCGMWFNEKVVASTSTIGLTAYNLVIADDVFSSAVTLEDGKAQMYRVIKAKKDREQVKQEREYECADVIWTPTGIAETKFTPDMVSHHVRVGIGEATLEVTDKEATLSGLVRDDVKLDLKVGLPLTDPDFTCVGKLLSGFVVDLKNRHGKWSWTNKK